MGGISGLKDSIKVFLLLPEFTLLNRELSRAKHTNETFLQARQIRNNITKDLFGKLTTCDFARPQKFWERLKFTSHRNGVTPRNYHCNDSWSLVLC